MSIKNRIIDSGEKRASEFVANPHNWRIHPFEQQDALREVLAEIGWVQDVIENKTTGNLIDGHMRVHLALEDDELVPFSVVELTPEEELKVLATLDPIASLAAADHGKLAELLADITIETDALSKLLSDLADDGTHAALAAESTDIAGQYAVMITCADEDQQAALIEEFLQRDLDVKGITL